MVKFLKKDKLTNDIPWCIDPNYNDEHFCGYINFSKMTNHLGKCKLWMFGYEGTIPHFYILNQNKKVVCAICLTSPKYYNCDEPHIFLGDDEIELLNDILKSQCENFNESIWEYMCKTWLRLKQNKEIKEFPKEIPNYLDLKNKEVAEMNMKDKYKTLKKQLKEIKNYMKLCKKYGIKC